MKTNLFILIVTSIALTVSCRKPDFQKPLSEPCRHCEFLRSVPNDNRLIPLKDSIIWTYDYFSGGQYDIFSDVTDGREVINGTEYFKIQKAKFPFDFYYVYSRNRGNGVYRYEPSLNKEFIELPANPVVGQTWWYVDDGVILRREVISTDSTIQGGHTSLKNLIVVSDYNNLNRRVATCFYKAGFGIVAQRICEGETEYQLAVLRGIYHQ